MIQQSAAMQQSGGKTMQQYIKSMEGEIRKALPAAITPERFTRIVLSAISANPQLADCTPKSFLAAMMACAQMGLECNTPLGQAYLIPYRNKGRLECQFQLG
jgi:recombination protein RecT